MGWGFETDHVISWIESKDDPGEVPCRCGQTFPDYEAWIEHKRQSAQ